MKNILFLCVFQGFAFFVLGPLGDEFWKVWGLILEAPGPLWGASGAILGAKMAPRGGQEAPRWVPGPSPEPPKKDNIDKLSQDKN